MGFVTVFFFATDFFATFFLAGAVFFFATVFVAVVFLGAAFGLAGAFFVAALAAVAGNARREPVMNVRRVTSGVNVPTAAARGMLNVMSRLAKRENIAV